MNAFSSVDPDTLVAGRCDWVDAGAVEALVADPLDSVETAYPHAVWSVDGPDDVVRPTEDHPVFYGSFDWHSSVHSHWCLVRSLRLFDDHPVDVDVVDSISRRFTAERVEQEVSYFEDDPSFENPYGWGWFLRLAAELALWDDDRATDWRATLRPLETRIVELVASELLAPDRVFRTGTHENTAFALQCVLDYARVTGDDDLDSAAVDASRECFAADDDYRIEYEPLGWDFLSPALTEADLMWRVLDADSFRSWFEGFLPSIATVPHGGVPDPVAVPADASGLDLHFAGLNLSRAWCLAGVASALDDHPCVGTLEDAARRHAKRGVERAFTDDYGGAHWLSSFVCYLASRNEGGIAPRGRKRR